MWSGGGLTRGNVSPGWFHKCRAIIPPSNSTCENKPRCENLKKATRCKIESMSESLSDGTQDPKHGRKFSAQSLKNAITQSQRADGLPNWFYSGRNLWTIVQLWKKMSHAYFVLVLWWKLTRTKRRQKKASHWTGNFVDEVGHFHVPLWQSSAVVCRQCDLDLLWTQTHNSVTASHCFFCYFRSRLVACCFQTSGGLPAASLHSGAASPVTLVARFRH